MPSQRRPRPEQGTATDAGVGRRSRNQPVTAKTTIGPVASTQTASPRACLRRNSDMAQDATNGPDCALLRSAGGGSVARLRRHAANRRTANRGHARPVSLTATGAGPPLEPRQDRDAIREEQVARSWRRDRRAPTKQMAAYMVDSALSLRPPLTSRCEVPKWPPPGSDRAEPGPRI